MIRVRRVDSGIPLVRTYELEFAPNATAAPTEGTKLRRAAAGDGLSAISARATLGPLSTRQTARGTRAIPRGPSSTSRRDLRDRDT